MTETLKVLGQSAPAAGLLTNLYNTVFAQATCSTIQVCNRSSTTDYFRIAVAVLAAADDPKQYLHYDAEIPPNSGLSMTIGVTLGPSDVLRVYSRYGNCSFNAFGVEVQ